MAIQAIQIARPFDPRERRTLTVRTERIDPRHLQSGRPPHIEAEHKRSRQHETHEARHYELDIAALPNMVRVQLNGGSSADDETRLVEATENLLAGPEGDE